jgi:hypothetical protein
VRRVRRREDVLVTRLRRVAEEQGAAHAYVDEHVHDVVQAMRRLADQLGDGFGDFAR